MPLPISVIFVWTEKRNATNSSKAIYSNNERFWTNFSLSLFQLNYSIDFVACWWVNTHTFFSSAVYIDYWSTAGSCEYRLFSLLYGNTENMLFLDTCHVHVLYRKTRREQIRMRNFSLWYINYSIRSIYFSWL